MILVYAIVEDMSYMPISIRPMEEGIWGMYTNHEAAAEYIKQMEDNNYSSFYDGDRKGKWRIQVWPVCDTVKESEEIFKAMR